MSGFKSLLSYLTNPFLLVIITIPCSQSEALANNPDKINNNLRQFFGIQSQPQSQGIDSFSTHHQSLGNNTMIGGSTMSTNAATSEGLAPTTYIPTASLAAGMQQPKVSVPQQFSFQSPSFSQQMLTAPSLQPMVDSEINVPRVISPASALGDNWPLNSSLGQHSMPDLGGTNPIEWGHGRNNGPFSLDQLTK